MKRASLIVLMVAAAACTNQLSSSPTLGPSSTHETTIAAANTVALATTPTTSTTSTFVAPKPSATSATQTPTTPTTPPPTYVFPFVGHNVSYGTTHHDYPAIDVFGCGAGVVAPTSGTVTQTRSTDLWNPKVNDPATRGGKYVAMIGDDGVRYYFAHLASISTAVGTKVAAGDALGLMGQTGDARLSACHTHVGISWSCPTNEWQVRRGEIWPPKYLDAWRKGVQLSPAAEVASAQTSKPTACSDAAAAKSAAAA